MANLQVPKQFDHLFAHLKGMKQIDDVAEFDKDILHIYSSKVLHMIVNNEPGWEKMVPPSVAKAINDKCLFGHPCFIGKKNKE